MHQWASVCGLALGSLLLYDGQDRLELLDLIVLGEDGLLACSLVEFVGIHSFWSSVAVDIVLVDMADSVAL